MIQINGRDAVSVTRRRRAGIIAASPDHDGDSRRHMRDPRMRFFPRSLRFFTPALSTVALSTVALSIEVLSAVALLTVTMAAPVAAKELRDFVPADAPNCATATPPATAGAAVTPGGVMIVYPRNSGITADYTGCKHLWVMQSDTAVGRFVTTYFKQGKLAVAVAHDNRSAAGTIVGVCTFPGGKSVFPKTGAAADRACAGVPAEYYGALRMPTFPRECIANPKAKGCTDKPS
jgi:hypothetical protein